MRLNYTFFDKEDLDGVIIRYEFEPPFYENLDNELKMEYGEDLTFIKEINHRDRIIRTHTAYDSGKGTKYVPPKKPKKHRQILRLRVKHILSLIPKENPFVLKIENEYEGEHLFILIGKREIHIFDRATITDSGAVSGYRTVISNYNMSLFRYLKNNNYYPYEYEFLEFPKASL